MTIILFPVVAGFVAQVLKFCITSNNKQFGLKHVFDYSGMPSGHTALVTSLSTILVLQEGWQSPVFGLSVILAAIVIRDAIGLRRYLGRHGKVLNDLIKDLDEDKLVDYKYPHLIERVGHTVFEVVVGALVGFLTSVIGYYILIA